MPDPTATDPVQFDYQTAQRVVRAVRAVEQMSGKQTGQRGGNVWRRHSRRTVDLDAPINFAASAVLMRLCMMGISVQRTMR